MIDWLIHHQRSVLFALAVLVLGGMATALRLPVSLFPTIAFPRISVSVEAGDRPVERMVVDVTRPIEQAIRGVPDVTNIRSTSSRGQADLSVSFAWGGDMVAAELQMASAINRVLTDLPAGTRFEVRRMDPTVFPVLGLTLRSHRHDLTALRRFAVEQLQPVLGAVPGVAAVEVLGGAQAEYQISIDPARLRAAAVTMDDISHALATSNEISAVGRIEDRNRLYLTLADARMRGRDDIAATVLRATNKGVVRLRDVGNISLTSAPNWTRVTAGGEDAVLVNIRQSRGANSVALVNEVRVRLQAMRAALPADFSIGTYYDQSELVRASAASVRDAILIGAFLSAIVLMIFLRSVRLTLIVAVALPSVLLSTTLLLGTLHMSFNIMTLGGMAAAVGLIVDDAVVMVEHMMRRLTEHVHAFADDRAAFTGDTSLLSAAAEMQRPLFGSSAATIIIFVPLAFIDGVTGGFFKALALTMACALIISLLVALLAVPLLTNRLANARTAAALEAASMRFARVRAFYARTAAVVLARRVIAPIVAVALLVAGTFAYLNVSTGFIPAMDEGGFVLDYFAPPGTSLSETDRLLRLAEARIAATPEVDNFSRRTGLQLGGGLTEANEGDFFIHLKPLPRRPIEEVMTDVRERIEAQVPGLQIETLQLMEDLIGDLTAVPQPVEVKLFGTNLTELKRSGKIVAAAIGHLPGIVEVQNGNRTSGDAVTVQIDGERAALEGLDSQTIAAQLNVLVGGSIAGQIQTGEQLINLRLQGAADTHKRIEDLGELPLHSPKGYDLPLRRIATIQVQAGQPQITRENLSLMVAVTARLEGRDLGAAMQDVRRSVHGLQLPPGVRVEYGGLWAEQQKSFADLAAVLGAGVLLVTALLLFLYERVAVIAAILSAVVLSAAAVLIGLWITRTPLDISALMGMTMIVGMVTEIAIFYFAEVDATVRANAATLVHAGTMRLRPILMTTLIAILALAPLALGIGTGSAMQRPLAIAIISGLIAALPLVLLVMPAIYLRLSGDVLRRGTSETL